MRKTTFKWLGVFAAGAALFCGYILWIESGGICSTPKEQRVKGDFQSIGSAVRTYIINAGCPPSSRQGLEALVSRPSDEPLPDDWFQMMDKVPTDPWRQAYHYRELAAKPGVWRWELRSGGPDGRLWTVDDLRVTNESKSFP